MALYNPGAGKDSVLLKINGLAINTFVSYSVRKSILTQPSQFNVRLGYGQIFDREGKIQVTADFLKLVPPNSFFQLYINDTLQQTGYTDGYRCGADATEIEVFGRDVMRSVHDASVMSDQSFKDMTYKSMTQRVLDILGVNVQGEKARLITSDAANLKATTGVGISHFVEPETIDKIEPVSEEPTNKEVRRAIVARVTETYYSFLQRQYHRAGLFLWAGGDGSFILTEPNGDQGPTYRLTRERGQFRNAVNITKHSFDNDITRRYTSAHVFGRSPGRRFGRPVAIGQFINDEMNELFKDAGFGNDAKPIAFRDVNVNVRAQAEFYARRKLAEFNRAAWKLQYTVPGHTAPNIQTGLTSTWAPNTVVEVIDQELGIRDNFYLEEVVFARPPTTTTLTLMRLQDLIFGSDDEEP